VALGGLRAAIAAAPVVDRSVIVTSDAPASQAATLDRGIRPELQRALALPGGHVVRIASSPPFADASADPASVRTLTAFASFENIEAHAALASGRWPTAGATPLEASLSEAAAGVLKLKAGDHLTLVSRLQTSLKVEIVITGTWRPAAGDAYWLDSPLEVGGSIVEGSYTTVGPIVIPDVDLESRPFGDRISYEWRGLPDPAGYRIDDVAAVKAAVQQLDTRIKLALPVNTQFRVATGLPKILEVVERSVLVSRTGVLLLVVQYAVLALYAIVLVAGMLSDRRRAETALLRTRGASSGHLAAMGIFEAILLAGSAALLAPLAALLAVRWLVTSQPIAGSIGGAVVISRDALTVDAVTALIGIAALSLPALGGGRNLAGVRAAISRQTGRTLARRLGLDLALVVVAVIAVWQLRQYGAPLTRNARGVLGIDPLLVAAPAIGLLAGAVIATRLLPRGLEIAESLLERSRGLVAPMGGRGLARRPLRYTRSALLLMLAASLGTFAVANVATWTRSQADQAAYQAGANLRLTPSSKATAPAGLASDLAAVPGVTAVMPVDRLSVDAGRAVRGDALLAIDAEVAAAVTNPTPGTDRGAQAGLFAQLAAGRPSLVGAAVPDAAVALGFVLDASFVKDFENGDPQAVDMSAFRGIRASVVVEDGLGRFHQLDTTTDAVLAGTNQRLVINLATGTPPASLARPIHLRRVEFGVSAPTDIGMTGSIEVREVDATAVASADPAAETAWSPIDLTSSTPGWEARVHFGSSASQPLNPTADPWHFEFKDGSPLPPVFGGFTSEIVVGFTARSAGAPIDAIASAAFLDATGARVGGQLTTTLAGTTASVHLVGSIPSFPTLDPARPFLIVDDRTLADARFAASGSIQPPTEWWLSTRDPAASAAALRAGTDHGAVIISAADREAALLADPIPRGVIGVLGLGSWAALVFAAIGFIVSATVSTRERLGEFALLRALGLSGRQLSLWLALEHTFLLTVGVAAGVGLGAVLAWLVLPFATLTTSGAAVTPPPVVVIPLASLLPILAGAAAVLLATLLLMRRQLLGIRIGDVLRAADE